MHRDWIELLELFGEKKVRFIVIGGMAVVFHGHERSTKDLDVWVANDRKNAKRVYEALVEWGAAGMADLSPKDFHNSDNYFVFGAEPYRIDILLAPPGLDFDTAWTNRVRHKYEGKVLVNFISRDDLVLLKEAAGRLRDRQDIRALKRIAKIEAKAAAPPKSSSKKKS